MCPLVPSTVSLHGCGTGTPGHNQFSIIITCRGPLMPAEKDTFCLQCPSLSLAVTQGPSSLLLCHLKIFSCDCFLPLPIASAHFPSRETVPAATSLSPASPLGNLFQVIFASFQASPMRQLRDSYSLYFGSDQFIRWLLLPRFFIANMPH